MIKIGINLDGVLRDFLGQMEYVYNKYISTGETTDINISKDIVGDYDLVKYFGFENKTEYNKFLYREASLEIFGHADELLPNIMVGFNEFMMDLVDFYNSKVIIINKEVGAAIPSTLFYLSKTSCKCTDIRFVNDNESQWEDIDIMISSLPDTLKSKPEGKISVKVNTPYNNDIESDYTIDNLFEWYNNKSMLKEIIEKLKQ